MKKTKIICTIGPASEAEPTMRELIKIGMNVVRMNFSHGDYEEQGARIKTTRKLNAELGTNVALMLDTKGPEIRTHLFEGGKVQVEKGSTVSVYMNEITGDATKFSVTYAGLINDVEIGGTILVDDGYLELKVESKDMENGIIVCKAMNSHKLKNKRGINVPNVKLNMDFISPKDKADIEFACDQDLDFIAASFVRRADDVRQIREILKAKGNDNIKIISKIENQEGVDNLDEIVEASDGIMVARGDMGVEIPAWEVPNVQKTLVDKCQSEGKYVVVATQMLESMQNNPRPTRAEVNDVANAVLDGTDATMLSGESANGDYPIESVKYMAQIDERMDEEMDYDWFLENGLYGNPEDMDEKTALGMAAAKIALEFDAKAIITDGCSCLARQVSRFRPCCPVIASVKDGRQARSLALAFGVTALVADKAQCIKFMEEKELATKGDMYIVVTNDSVKIETLK